MEKVLNQLVERLQKTFGERLVSAVLYGSAVSGDHHARFSDLNVMCVLTQVTPRELADSEPIFRWWREQGNPAPLLLSEHEVTTSTDCFAIEFHDIQERRRVLAGRDVLDGLVIDDAFYRARVEYELRAKMLRLRQKAAGLLSNRALLLRLMADSVSTFCVLGRHALRLVGQEAQWGKREVTRQVAERFGGDPAPILTLIDLREGKVKQGSLDPTALLEQYLKEIQTVVDAVDGLER